MRYFQTEIRRLSSEGDEAISRRYDGEGNITQETDPLGRITGMDYDAFNRLKSVSGPLSSGRLIDYDPAGNMLSETVLNLPTNSVRGNDYDPANRVKNQTDAEGGVSTFEYFPNGTVKAQIDPRGNRSEFSYNALNLVLRRSQPYQGGDAVWTFEYDENGNLTTENLPNGNRIEHDYDELNRESARRDSEGPIVAFGYDAAGNVKSETDGNGNVSTFNYNELNQRTDELRPLGRNRLFTYTAFGEVKTETDAIDNTLTHSIDDLGRRRGTTGPLGLNLAFEFDRAGNLLSSTDSRGVVSSFVYNDLNQRTDETVTGLGETYTRSFGYDRVGNVTSETDRRGIVSLRFYDKENRLKRFERDGKVQERRDYDKAGNLLFLTDANGNTTGFEYEQRNLVKQENRPESLITQFTRDAMGDAVFEDRPGQRDIERAYDLRRRLKEETNGAGETTAFEYDANNNQTARIRPLGETYRWTFRYDDANRLEEVEDPLGHVTHYDYDTRDNRTAHTDANNRTTGFDYDARNRLKQKTYPDLARVDYGYDANGNLTTLDLPHGVHVDYDYDALNRRTDLSFIDAGETIDVALTLDPNGNVTLAEETIAGTTHRTGLNFDRLDRLTRITDRHDQSLQYGYDANGNRKELIDHRNQRTDYRYDAINRLDQVIIPGLGTIDYDYHPDGRLKAVIFPNGSQSSYNYDRADRIDTIAHRQSGEEVAFYDYDHDDNGNRARQEVRNGQGTEITTYNYDRADRLADVFYPDRTVNYSLDPVGNRTQETATPTPSSPFPGYVRNYDYNTRDQLIQVDDDQGLLITYQYDENGNQVQKTENGSTTTFGYSARDRLTTVTPQGQTPIQFSYDYRGLRQEKQANGNTTRYVYDEQSLLAETNTLGNTIARYHYGSDRRLAETRGTQNAYFMIDALGTPIAVTTQEGTVQTRYTYDAWGNLDRKQGESEQPFGFTGYVKDEETDLYYAQQRYYDSFTGRFLREDPFEGDIQTPPSLHRYLYAHVNPTVFVDPTGEAVAVGPEIGAELLSALENNQDIVRPSADLMAFLKATGNKDLISSRFEWMGNSGHSVKFLTNQAVQITADLLVEATKANSSGSAFIVAEDGDTPDSVFEFMKAYVGEFGDHLFRDEHFRQLSTDIKSRDIIDISFEFNNAVTEADLDLRTGPFAFIQKTADAFSEVRSNSSTTVRILTLPSQLLVDGVATTRSAGLRTTLNPLTNRPPQPLVDEANFEAGISLLTGGVLSRALALRKLRSNNAIDPKSSASRLPNNQAAARSVSDTTGVPHRLARVVDARFGNATRLGAPNAGDVFVTAADDIADIGNSSDLARRLTLLDDDGQLRFGPFTVVEFDNPITGLASPVFRTNAGFLQGGLTRCGAREFVLPSGPVSDLTGVTRRIVE